MDKELLTAQTLTVFVCINGAKYPKKLLTVMKSLTVVFSINGVNTQFVKSLPALTVDCGLTTE